MASDSNSVVIDDNDIRVKYTGNWEVVKDSNQWLETSHSTWDFDASASVSFNGTGVRVYGTVPIGTGTSVTDYSLSRSSKSSSSPPGTSSIRVWQKSGKDPIYSKEFWYSGPLEYGQYSLTIKNKGEDDDQDFQLDRFVIETGESSTSSPSSQSSSLSISPTQGTGLPLNSASSIEGNGTVLWSTETSKSSVVPKIVGPIVAVAIIAILLLCWLLFRRRKAQKTANLQAAKGELPVNPFVLPANQTGTYPGTTAQMSTSPTSASASSPTIQTPRYGAEKSAYSLIASRSRANTYEGGLSPTSEGGATPSVTAVSITTGSGGSPVRLGGANRRETVGTSATLDELSADPPPSYQPPNSTTI